MQKFPKLTGVIRLKNLVYDSEGNPAYGSDDVTRFYNRNFYTFDFPIHEQVCQIDLSKRDEILQCFVLPMEVIHHGYALTPEEMQAKQERNLEMLYKNLESNPKLGSRSLFSATMKKQLNSMKKGFHISLQ